MNNKEKPKALLMTWYRNCNYGTYLQAYALKEVLKENYGINAYFVPYEPKGKHSLKIVIKKIFSLKIWKKQIISRIDRIRLKAYYPEIQKRIQIFDKAIHEEFFIANGGRAVKSKEDFLKLGKEYELYITGSDQIWNPLTLNEHFLLDFVESGKKKIAYGSSLCAEQIPKDKIRLYQKWLRDFAAVSIRESSCKEQLEEIIGKDVRVVVDPVILYGKEEWLKKIDGCNIQKYIFSYFLGNSKSQRKVCLELAADEKCEIINFPQMSMPKYSNADKLLEGKSRQIWDASPWAFLGYIKNSEFVLTDSFHVTVFCILFHKKFCTFIKDKKHMEQNERIKHLLSLCGLEDHFAEQESLEVCRQILETNVEWKMIDRILWDEREKSRKYLDYAINLKAEK